MKTEIKEKLIENLTQNLPTLRAKASLSQARLAEMVGISRQTLVAIENRKRSMAWNTFLSIFLVFNKNPETNLLLKVYEIDIEELDDLFKTDEFLEKYLGDMELILNDEF